MRRVCRSRNGGVELRRNGLARGDVTKISWPSWKNSRFSGKNVSNADRFTITSSASTLPKSGFRAAVIWKLEDGRHPRSSPTLPETLSPRRSYVLEA